MDIIQLVAWLVLRIGWEPDEKIKTTLVQLGFTQRHFGEVTVSID